MAVAVMRVFNRSTLSSAMCQQYLALSSAGKSQSVSFHICLIFDLHIDERLPNSTYASQLTVSLRWRLCLLLLSLTIDDGCRL